MFLYTSVGRLVDRIYRIGLCDCDKYQYVHNNDHIHII